MLWPVFRGIKRVFKSFGIIRNTRLEVLALEQMREYCLAEVFRSVRLLEVFGFPDDSWFFSGFCG